MMLRKGDTVSIYSDPVTQQKVEGSAVLGWWLATFPDTGEERWYVAFESDPGDYYMRSIYPPLNEAHL